MDMARYLVEAHLKEGRSVASLASEHGVHRSWLYKLLARYQAEGEHGSRRSLSAATQLADPGRPTRSKTRSS